MGIRLRTGLELCNLLLWFTREFVQAGNGAERLDCPPAGKEGQRVGGQDKKRSGSAALRKVTREPQRGKPSLPYFTASIFQGESTRSVSAKRQLQSRVSLFGS